MSAEAGFDFNTQAIRMGLGMGGGGQDGDPVANQKDMLENLLDNVGSGSAGVMSTITGSPHLGEMGSKNMFAQFEIPEGLHEKMINPFGASFSTKGGFLYRMFSALIKNGEITDMTEGIEGLEVGGSDYGEGGGGDGGGGGDTGAGFGEASFSDFGGGNAFGEGANIESLFVDATSGRFQVSDASESILGDITPSSGGGGVDRGGGLEV